MTNGEIRDIICRDNKEGTASPHDSIKEVNMQVLSPGGVCVRVRLCIRFSFLLEVLHHR